jgi:transcriptional regulator with XRE-family HTH domain
MEFGSRLKKAREAKKLSQQEVSQLLGVFQKTPMGPNIFLSNNNWILGLQIP